MYRAIRSSTIALVFVCVLTPGLLAQRVTTPQEALGFTIGDDYHLATYTQFRAYWLTLADESPRMEVREIGRTAEGRPQLMAIVTSPENHANLERYQSIARRLALAEGITEDEARALAKEGKAIVWIDGGLHATEVLGAHQLMETVYELVSRTDDETLRFLDDVIVLAVHANPDGMELVSEWYMEDPVTRSTRDIPRLYQKYIGHDNNRDFYMASQPETENMARIMFRKWFPQIVYNHHQTGPSGTVMFAPPFRDPFNYNYDPLVPLGIDAVGAAMHSRFVEEGKPGTTMRSGASYSTWWNGGLRTTVYFHNMIGLLTETIGHPTPIEIPLLPDLQLPRNDLPAPITPQPWHFRQSIDYSVTANRAVLDYASRQRELLLFRIWRMGMNSIERGSRDHWTMHPQLIEEMKAAVRADGLEIPTDRRSSVVSPEYLERVRSPEGRDPRGYILPADQPDFPTTTKFVNALIKNGVTVHQATADFMVSGRRYPAGSYIVKTAQAFRPHILDMFEPQDHPNDFAYPGGPPTHPYDNAGWTLAYLMGVGFDRLLDGFTGPFEPVGEVAGPVPGHLANTSGASGFLMSHAYNDAAVVANRLMAAGHAVYWLSQSVSVDGETWPEGTVYISSGPGVQGALESMARELGVNLTGIATAPKAATLRLRPIRIALWDEYGGSMASGWTRWLLERFEFPFELVFPEDLDRGNLRESFDAIILVDRAFLTEETSPGSDPDTSAIPAEYHGRLGKLSTERTIPALQAFLDAGGTVITIGSSTGIAYGLGLPVRDHLVGDDGTPVSDEEYYMPGSVHRVRVDTSWPVTWGLSSELDVFFNNSPVFAITEGAQSTVKALAWFDSGQSLRSGWAWGGEFLSGGVAMAEARVGQGTLYLFGPEILNRGQTHGTFKLLFNALHLAGASAEPPLPTASNP